MVNGTIELRDVTRDDLPVLFEYQRDAAAAAMAGLYPLDRERFLAHWDMLFADPAIVTKGVWVDGNLAGHVIAFDRRGVRQIGYWIDPAMWGRQIASRAVAALLDIERQRPLHAYVAGNNAASLRILEKAGFKVLTRQLGNAGGRGPEQEEVFLILE